MNKRIIIVEGPDTCGKDTLISNLVKTFDNPIVIHSVIPNIGIKTKAHLFDFYMNGLIHDTLDAYYDKVHDGIIHNRSMYGEFVYGPKYRGNLPSEIAGMIHKIEVGQLRTFIFSHELYFILLTSSNAALLSNNDDGKSYSAEVADIEDEINAFTTIFNLSSISNKKKVFVNDGDKFRDKKDILHEVLDFLNE